MAVKLLNVDLELESAEPLDFLCLELSGWGIHHLHCEPTGRGFSAALECSTGTQPGGVDELICRFCEAIEGVDERARGQWDAANQRCFDVGCEVTDATQQWQAAIRPATLVRVAALGASIGFTVYPRRDCGEM